MDWPEIKRRLTKEGTSVQILADLEGVPYKTMYQRIKWHERQDGKKYMPEMKTKKKKKAEAEKVGREIVEGLPKFEADPEAKKAAPLPAIDFADLCRGDMPINPDAAVRKALGKPADACCNNCKWKAHRDNEPCCWRGHPYAPTALCSEHEKYIPEEKSDIPEDVYTNERKLMPETIEEILTMYKQCCELAERYQKQAEDWARIMNLLQLEESERIRRT